MLLSSVPRGRCLRVSLSLSFLTWEMGEMTGRSPSQDCKDQLRKHPFVQRVVLWKPPEMRGFSHPKPQFWKLSSNGLT